MGKRILFINSVCGYGSTGKICIDLAEKLLHEGNEVKIAYGRGRTDYSNAIKIGRPLDNYIHIMETRLFDNHGLASKRATAIFLKWADQYDPDCLWLHNLHGYYINYEMLFEWIKKRPQMIVKWTLHDCWSFTGHCTYFSMVNCDKWKSQCSNCCQKKQYPSSYIMDCSADNYNRKKKAFSNVQNMVLITPSAWLKKLVKQSFLGQYTVEVVKNTIDREIFHPRESNFREKYNLNDKIIILGVANIWTERKGYLDFIELSKLLDDRFRIFLVGLSKKQIKKLPSEIMGISRTRNQIELAEIYTAADVYVNPSREETYGLTNAEALACGTPTIVYKDTACEEVARENGGIVVEQNIMAIYDAIKSVLKNKVDM